MEIGGGRPRIGGSGRLTPAVPKSLLTLRVGKRPAAEPVELGGLEGEVCEPDCTAPPGSWLGMGVVQPPVSQDKIWSSKPPPPSTQYPPLPTPSSPLLSASACASGVGGRWFSEAGSTKAESESRGSAGRFGSPILRVHSLFPNLLGVEQDGELRAEV